DGPVQHLEAAGRAELHPPPLPRSVLGRVLARRRVGEHDRSRRPARGGGGDVEPGRGIGSGGRVRAGAGGGVPHVLVLGPAGGPPRGAGEGMSSQVAGAGAAGSCGPLLERPFQSLPCSARRASSQAKPPMALHGSAATCGPMVQALTIPWPIASGFPPGCQGRPRRTLPAGTSSVAVSCAPCTRIPRGFSRAVEGASRYPGPTLRISPPSIRAVARP